MDANAITDLSAGINGNIRKKIHLFSKLAVRADMIAALQNRTRTDSNLLAENTIRSDVSCSIDLRRCRNNCRRVYFRGEGRFGKKYRKNFRKGYSGIRHPNQDLLA